MRQNISDSCREHPAHSNFQSIFLIRFVQIEPRRSALHSRFPDFSFRIVKNLPQGSSDRESIRQQSAILDPTWKHPQAPKGVEPYLLCQISVIVFTDSQMCERKSLSYGQIFIGLLRRLEKTVDEAWNMSLNSRGTLLAY